MKLTGINQLTLRVNDLREAEYFYCELLGIPLDRRIGANIAYLRLNTDLLVLVKAETPGSPQARDIRVDHFGFRLATEHEVDEAARYLENHGVHLVTRPSKRREGRAFFVMDPDGNLVEFYSMSVEGISEEAMSVKMPAATAPPAVPGGSRTRRSRK